MTESTTEAVNLPKKHDNDFMISQTNNHSSTAVNKTIKATTLTNKLQIGVLLPKLNKLKPKPTNPYHYKYNLININNDSKPQIAGSFNSGFGSRTLNSRLSSGYNFTTNTITGDYISTNKYNPYNNNDHQQQSGRHQTITSRNSFIKGNTGWKPSQTFIKSSSRPRSQPHVSLPLVNGNWSQWTTYGPCISECVTITISGPGDHSSIPIGIMTSLRRCNNPSPLGDGLDCVGPDTKVKLCNAYQVCYLS